MSLRLALWDVPGQRADLFAWIDSVLAGHGARRRSEPPEIRVRVYSTTARFSSTLGPVWFKAAAPGNRFESGLLAALARWVPGSAPEPLGTDPARGWSLLPHAGPMLREQADPDDPVPIWAEILGAYAELQRTLSAHVPAAIALGVPDLRPEALGTVLDRFLADQDVRDALGDRRLAALEHDRPGFDADRRALARSGVPASLDQADLHTGNVAQTAGAFVFHDWGDAVATHPFTAMMGPLRHVERTLTAAPRDLTRLRDAYLEPWTAEHDRAHLTATLATARRLGALTRALAWSRSFPELADQAGPRRIEQTALWLRRLVEPEVPGAL